MICFMKLYVVRHGESETNLSKQWTGWFDAPLTEKGKEDAMKVRSVLDRVPFDKVFSSDLERAKVTAEIATGSKKYETDPLLREINVGNLERTLLSDFSNENRAVAGVEGYVRWNGESREEFRERICEFMRKAESFDCENIAVFTHRGWLFGILGEVLGVEISRRKILCANCAVGIFDCSDGVWSLNSWINAV